MDRNKVWIRGVGNSNLDDEENVSWFTLGWAVDGIGFGEFSFKYNHKTDKWTCDNETMSKPFVTDVLKMLVDAYEETEPFQEKGENK